MSTWPVVMKHRSRIKREFSVLGAALRTAKPLAEMAKKFKRRKRKKRKLFRWLQWFLLVCLWRCFALAGLWNLCQWRCKERRCGATSVSVYPHYCCKQKLNKITGFFWVAHAAHFLESGVLNNLGRHVACGSKVCFIHNKMYSVNLSALMWKLSI